MPLRPWVLGLLVLGVACREPNPVWNSKDGSSTEPASTETGSDGSAEESTGAELVCEDHEEACGDECVDLLVTPEHCGTCFEACRPPERNCENGECVR